MTSPRRRARAVSLALAVTLAAPAVAQPPADLRTALLAAADQRVQSLAHRQRVASALSQESPELRVLALRAIGRTQRAEFLPQALAGLRHASIDVRREAAFAVAHIGSGAAGALAGAEAGLRSALDRETDALVFAALAEEYGRLPFDTITRIDDAARVLRAGLTRLGEAGAVPPLTELGVARAAEALARRSARAKAVAADVRALLTGLFNAGRNAADAPADLLRARMRRLAVAGFLSLDAASDGASAEAFELAAIDSDPQVRRLGVIGLTRRRAVSLEQASGWLEDDAMIVRHAAVARVGPKMPAIAEAGLDDPNLNVRLAALDALGEAAACRAPCTSRLDRPDGLAGGWHEGAHALEAFARTAREGARTYVARAAASPVWQVRMYAARSAEHTGQADVLARLAADPEANVQHAALVAWRAARLPGLEAAAVAALASDDGQLLLEAARALEPGTGFRVPGTEVIGALRAALERASAQRRETSRDWRIALLERLDEFDPERTTTLRRYLSDFDVAVADRAAALINARLPPAAARVTSSPQPLPREALPAWSDLATIEKATVTFRLRGGRSLVLRLYPYVAPTAVARLVAQVRAGEWNGRTFHRVEPGFVVQGGSPAANEYAGAAAFARDEFSALSHVRGTVGISTRGPDTGDGQIFFNLVDNPRLDYGFTLIGSLASASSVLDDVVEGEVIERATIDMAGR